MCYSIAYLEKKAKKLAERYKDFFPADWSEEHLRSQPGHSPPNTSSARESASKGAPSPYAKQYDMSLFDDELEDPREKDPDEVSEPGDLPTFFFVSGFSFPFLPVIRHDGLHLCQWGLVPQWTKDADFANTIRSKTLNARGESVFEKPSFRGSITSKRCLLPVSGFFEWREISNKKYPYFIRLREEGLFSLGCIYDTWTDKQTGEHRQTFSIITTPANPLMEKVHNKKKRMPLIIGREDEVAWNDPVLGASAIKRLIMPFDEQQMVAHTVSRMLNNPRSQRDIPEALEKVTYEGVASNEPQNG